MNLERCCIKLLEVSIFTENLVAENIDFYSHGFYYKFHSAITIKFFPIFAS